VHVTSSPHYPQSNGLTERAVKTVKKLLKESTDQCLALLSYRTTPLPWCGLSPAELSQGRRLRSDIPQVKQNLVPKWAYTKEFHRLDEEFKLRQKQYFDNRHRVKPLPDIPDDTDVWVTTDGQPVTGRVVTHADAPRSYVVNTSNGSTIRRNRSQINVVPNSTSAFVFLLAAIARAHNPTVIASVAPRKGTRRLCPHRSDCCRALMLTCQNSPL